MTTEPLPDDNARKDHIEILTKIYDTDEFPKWQLTYDTLKLIHTEIADLAWQRAPFAPVELNHPLLMKTALRIALSDPSTKTKADLELAGVKATKPETSLHFMEILHEFSRSTHENLLTSSYLATFMPYVRGLSTNITCGPVTDVEYHTFMQALNIFAASKVESFLEEYRNLLRLSSPNLFARLEATESFGIQQLYVTMFNDAVHCATLLHTSNKGTNFQIKRSTESTDHGGTYIFSISATPIDPPSGLEFKSFNELIDNIQNEATATREGVISNGQVALQVSVKREYIEDTTRRD